MEKFRRMAAGVLFVMIVIVMTACGRRNGDYGTTAPSTGNTGTGTTMESPMNGSDSKPYEESRVNGESGGVLRDMVDDVGDGIHNLTEDVTGMSGTTAAGTEVPTVESRKAN